MFKRKGQQKPVPSKRQQKSVESDEESIASDDENLNIPTSPVADHDDFFEESVDEKRVRLARQYLEEVKESVKEKRGSKGADLSIHSESEASESESGNASDSSAASDVDARLRHESRLRKQQVKHSVADSFFLQSSRFMKGHTASPTCVRVRDDESKVLTGGKDGALIVWEVDQEGKKSVLEGKGAKKSAPVLAVEWVSESVVVSGGEDRAIRVWDLRTSSCVSTLRSHQGKVTGLRFQQEPVSSTKEGNSMVSAVNPGKLYSVSSDKSLKTWLFSGHSGAYQESFFGHTGELLGLDCMSFDRPVTAGFDKTVRFWNIGADSHQVFVANEAAGPIDSVVCLDNKHFLSGSQEGQLAVWGASYKKPMVCLDESSWVTAVGALRNSDLGISATLNELKFWKIAKPETVSKKAKIAVTPLSHLSVSIPGVVNAIDVGKTGRIVAAAIGRDHRLGRWLSVSNAKNGLWLGVADHSCEDL